MENKNQNTNGIFPDSNTPQVSAPVDFVQTPPTSTQALSLDPQSQIEPALSEQMVKPTNVFVRLAKRADIILALLLILGTLGFALNSYLRKDSSTSSSIASKFDTTQIPLDEFISTKQGITFGTQSVVINGSLQANNGLIITPTQQPASAVPGQLYFDQASNVPAYYNGTQFVSVSGVQSVGNLTGQVALGSGLSAAGGQLSNTGVLSVQGVTGNVTLSAGTGIGVNGTTISNTGILSVSSGSSAITVTNDGNGNITLSGSGSGTVSSTGGTTGTLPVFTGAQSIGDSIISQSGLTATVTGDLAVVTGGLTLTNALTVSNGGTGAASLALNGVLVGQGTGAITSVAAGSAGLCLVSTAGAPTWSSCSGGTNVSSLNSLTGALTVANASGAGSTITIDDASTIAKGIAQFNGTNFSVSAGVANTIQDIDTTAAPTFAGLNTNSITPTATLTVGATGQQLVLQGNASTQLTSTGGGFTTTVGFTGVPTGAVTYNFNRAETPGTYEICSSFGNCAGLGGSVGGSGTLNQLAKFTATGSTIGDSTITDNGVTVTTSVDFTVQGGSITVGVPSTQAGSIVFAHNGSANTGTITQGALTGNRTYTLPDANGTICLSVGNCSGTGSTNTLQAAYDAGNSISTTDARSISIVLANTTTDSNFDISVADDSTGYVSISRADGTGLNDPAQLLLIDNLDITRAVPVGIKLQASAGGLTTAIDASDADIGTAISVGANNIVGTTGNIDLTNFDVVGSTGNVSTAGNVNLSGGGQYQVSGVQISSADLSNDANLAKLNAAQTFTGSTNTFRNSANSASGFNVQNAAGTNIFNVDTTNGEVELGVSSSSNGRLVFNNVSNVNTVTVLPGTPSAARTITLPDASGIVCLDSGNCAGAGATLQTAYNFSTGGTTPKIKINSTLGSVDIQDADTSPGLDLFDVRASNTGLGGLGSVMFGIASQGAVTLQNAANSTAAMRILTMAGTSVLTVDTTNGQTILGQSGTLAGTLILRNASNTNTGTLKTAVLGQNTTYTLPDPATTAVEICVSSGNCSGSGSSNTLQAAYDAGNTITTTDGRDVSFTFADTTTDANFLINLQCSLSCSTNGRFAIQNAGTDVFSVSPSTGAIALTPATNGNITATTTGTGRITLQSASGVDVKTPTNSSTAFQVLNAVNGYVFKVNTTDNSLGLGFLTISTYSGLGGTLDTFLSDSLGLGTSSATNIDIGHSTSATTVLGTFVQNADSTTAFRVQDAAASTTVFDVDTTNGRIGVNNAAPGYSLDVTGSGAFSGNLRASQFIDNDNSSFYVNPSAGTGGLAAALQGRVSIGSSSLGAMLDITNAGSSPWTTTGINLASTFTPSSGGTQYNLKVVTTNAATVSANTTYGIDVSVVDATTLANTNYGLYVDASTANSNDVQYAAVFLNGNVGINTAAPSSDLTFGEGANRTINVLTRTTNAAGNSLTLQGGNAGAGATAVAGGGVVIQGGNAAGTTGNADGGNVVLTPGLGVNAGTSGTVIVKAQTGGDGEIFAIQQASGVSVFLYDTTNKLLGVNTSALNYEVTFTNAYGSTIGVNNGDAGNQTGQDLTLRAGAGYSGGNNNGGSVVLTGGNKGGTGTAGGVIVKNDADSATAFQVENAAGTSTVLDVDTSNGYVGVGTAAPSRQLHVSVSNSTTNALPLLIAQAGAGDSGLEFLTSSKKFFAGIDGSDGQFKIASAASANGTSNQGNTATSGTTDSNANGAQATKITASVTGTVSSVSVYISALDGTNNLIQVGVYADSAGVPGALLTSSSSVTATTGWNTIPVSGTSITSGTAYWIAMAENGNTSFTYTGGAGTTYYHVTTGYPLPDPFSQNSGPTTDYPSFYMTVSLNGSADNFGGTNLFSLSDTGAVIFQNQTDSINAFRVLNAAGTNTVLNVDTTNGNVGIGTYAPSSKLHVFEDVTGGASLATFRDEIRIAAIEILATANDTPLIHSGVNDSLNFASNNSTTAQLSIDTSGNVIVGTSDTTGALLVLDTKTGSGDPTGMNGAMYYNSNRGKMRCYEYGYWRDCMVDSRTGLRIFNEMYKATNTGEFAVQASGTGSGIAEIAAVAGHPGIVQESIDSSGDYSIVGANSSGDFTQILGNNDAWRYETVTRVPVLSTAGEPFEVKVGFWSTWGSTTDANSCKILYSNSINTGKWEGYCSSSSVASTCDTGITVAANTWYRLTIVVAANGSSVDFQVNGTSTCQITTNIPTSTAIGFGNQLYGTGGSTSRDVDVDYIEIIAELTPR